MDKNNKVIKWYDSGNFITNLIIICIAVIIIVSQSFATGVELSLAVFGSIINHNSIYLLILIYFIFLKFKFGKKYFNYLNVFLIFIYALASVTSLLTLVQAFSLNSVLTFILNCILLIYLFHTLFRDTRVWKEYKLYSSPFNEITNDWLFYAIVVVCVFLLAVNLISTVVLSGVILSTLDTVYYILFGRYIYLYREYLDSKKLDADNDGNFDSVREKVQDVLDKTEIDDKLIEIKDKIVDGAKDLVNKFDNDTNNSSDGKIEVDKSTEKSESEKVDNTSDNSVVDSKDDTEIKKEDIDVSDKDEKDINEKEELIDSGDNEESTATEKKTKKRKIVKDKNESVKKSDMKGEK